MLAVCLVLVTALVAGSAPSPSPPSPHSPSSPSPPSQQQPSPSSAPATKMKLLVMDLAVDGGVDAGTAAMLTGVLAAELAAYHAVDVVAHTDVRRLMELEGEKQELGCGDTSCLAEIAGAMGARLVMFGSVGRLGHRVVVQLQMLDVARAQGVGREVVEAADLDGVPAQMREKVRTMMALVYAAHGHALPSSETTWSAATASAIEPPAPWGAVAIAGGVVGLVLGGGAAFFGGLPWIDYRGALARHAAAGDDVDAAVAARKDGETAAAAWNGYGQATTIAGGALAGTGAVAVVAGVALALTGGGE